MSRPHIPADLKVALRVAESLEWTITRTGRGHLRWAPPAGKPAFTGSTRGRFNRSHENDIAQLRRAGLPV